MNAFLTGSRVYGRPREDSDWDLAVRCDKETAQRLAAVSDMESPDQSDSEYSATSACIPVRFGVLNLLLCVTDESFAEFVLGTVDCIRAGCGMVGGLSKEDSIETFAGTRKRSSK